MQYTNDQMETMLKSLEPLLSHKDLIGYAAARNTRVLENELVEYHKVRDELVMKHGEPVTDAQGKQTGAYAISDKSESFTAFVEELIPYLAITHEPNLFKVNYTEAIGVLTGSEMLAVEWMFKDE